MITVTQTLRNILAAALGLAALAAPASATSVTIGNANDANCYPFGCAATDNITQYQQAYNHEVLSGPLTFNTLEFSQNYTLGPLNGIPYGPHIDTASYDVSFYLAKARFTSLAEDLPSNLGAFLGKFGTFNLGGTVPDILRLSGNTITYDPSQGDLLMNVDIFGVTRTQGAYGTYQNFFNADSDSLVTSRAWAGTLDGSYGSARQGLQTTFALIPGTPEPATWVMMVLGFGIAGAALRRRRSLPTTAVPLFLHGT